MMKLSTMIYLWQRRNTLWSLLRSVATMADDDRRQVGVTTLQRDVAREAMRRENDL